MGQTALIVGGAPCVRDDLDAARALRPGADEIAVKFAVAFVKAKFAVTHHSEHAERIKAVHRAHWGGEIEVHMPKKTFPALHAAFVDRIWPELAGVGGTSAWGAARIARLMGYEEVILCGCPLEVVAAGEPTHDTSIFVAARWAGAPADRGEPFYREHAIHHYRNFIHSDRDLGRSEGIVSMSGWTRKLLGAPHVR